MAKLILQFAFNFNYKKYNKFKNIIGNDPEVEEKTKEKAMDQLKRCAQNHHSFLNFSLMPRTGGLNNTKGEGYDDPISFWNKLDKYLGIPLETRKNNLCVIFKDSYEIFNHTTYPNLKAIKLFLDQFETTNNFLEKVYFIKKESLEKEFEELSKCKIGSFDWLKSYMYLAEKYWAKRYNRLILENGKGNGKGLKCFFVASDGQPVARGTGDQPYFKIYEKDENLKI